MAKLRPESFGPTLSVNVTSAIVAGTTSNYEDYEAFGPVQIISDTVFNAGCVMLTDGGDEPPAAITYPAGLTLYKYFSTIQLTSGEVEMVGIKDKADLGF